MLQTKGGAIYSENIITDNLTADYTFTGNKSNSGAGGAIFTEASLHMVANHLIFKSNISDSSGGAIYSKDDIYLYGNYDQDHLFTVTFNDNSSGSVGGAIAGKNITLQGGQGYEFNTNTSKMDGGAIYADNSLSFNAFINFVFHKNTSTTGFGGAIASHILDMSALFPDFSGNHAKAGGAIYTDTDLFIPYGTGFSYNSADSSGGAIYSKNDITLYTDIGLAHYFTNNSSSSVGGAISAQKLILDGSTVFTNNRSDGSGGSGGAIYITDLSLNTNTYTFNNNTSNASGGAINIQNSIYLTLDNSNTPYLEMSGNSALDASDIWINTNDGNTIQPKPRPGFYKNVENKQLDLSNISLAGMSPTINDFSLIWELPGICKIHQCPSAGSQLSQPCLWQQGTGSTATFTCNEAQNYTYCEVSGMTKCGLY